MVKKKDTAIGLISPVVTNQNSKRTAPPHEINPVKIIFKGTITQIDRISPDGTMRERGVQILAQKFSIRAKGTIENPLRDFAWEAPGSSLAIMARFSPEEK